MTVKNKTLSEVEQLKLQVQSLKDVILHSWEHLRPIQGIKLSPAEKEHLREVKSVLNAVVKTISVAKE